MKNNIHVLEFVDVNVPGGHKMTFYKSQLFIKYYLTSGDPAESP